MANYDEIMETLRTLNDKDLFMVYYEYSINHDDELKLHYMIDFDEEMENIKEFCSIGVRAKYYHVYMIMNYAVNELGFDPDDKYFTIFFDYAIKSYNHVDDFLDDNDLFGDLADYILDNNDCLGNIDIEMLLKEEEC